MKNKDLGHEWGAMTPKEMDKKSYPCVTLHGKEFMALPDSGEATFAFSKVRESHDKKNGEATVELELRRLVTTKKAKVKSEKSTEEVLDALREEVEEESEEEMTD